ncbi:MAG: hypothetical protein ACE5K2_04205 [Candidatus Zixiibacteriota bacterium]
MGRVYDTIVLDSKSLHALFDSGVVHNYITKEVAEGLTTQVIPEPFEVGLGGKTQTVSDACLVVGRVQDRLFDFSAHVIEDIGRDENGKEIDVIIGATEMQRWNIKIDPKDEKLDLSRFRKEFIEY